MFLLLFLILVRSILVYFNDCLFEFYHILFYSHCGLFCVSHSCCNLFRLHVSLEISQMLGSYCFLQTLCHCKIILNWRKATAKLCYAAYAFVRSYPVFFFYNFFICICIICKHVCMHLNIYIYMPHLVEAK